MFRDFPFWKRDDPNFVSTEDYLRKRGIRAQAIIVDEATPVTDSEIRDYLRTHQLDSDAVVIENEEALNISERKQNLYLRQLSASVLVFLLVFLSAGGLIVVVLHGLEILVFTEAVVLALIGQTVGSTAGLGAIVIKNLFPETIDR